MIFRDENERRLRTRIKCMLLRSAHEVDATTERIKAFGDALEKLKDAYENKQPTADLMNEAEDAVRKCAVTTKGGTRIEPDYKTIRILAGVMRFWVTGSTLLFPGR